MTDFFLGKVISPQPIFSLKRALPLVLSRNILKHFFKSFFYKTVSMFASIQIRRKIRNLLMFSCSMLSSSINKYCFLLCYMRNHITQLDCCILTTVLKNSNLRVSQDILNCNYRKIKRMYVANATKITSIKLLTTGLVKNDEIFKKIYVLYHSSLYCT